MEGSLVPSGLSHKASMLFLSRGLQGCVPSNTQSTPDSVRKQLVFLWVLPLGENSGVTQIQEGVLSVHTPPCSQVAENPTGHCPHPFVSVLCAHSTCLWQQPPSARLWCIYLSASERFPSVGSNYWLCEPPANSDSTWQKSKLSFFRWCSPFFIFFYLVINFPSQKVPATRSDMHMPLLPNPAPSSLWETS